jgi:hypothetical protein
VTHQPQLYEALWTDAKLISPERFNTWPPLRELAATATRRCAGQPRNAGCRNATLHVQSPL